MPYKTALRGQVNLGAAAFDLTAEVPCYDRVALAGSNSSPLSFTDAISSLLEPTGLSLELPGDFPGLWFDQHALQITVSTGGVSLSGTSAAEWKNPFGILKGLTLHNFQLEYSSTNRTLSFVVGAEYGSLRPRGQLLFDGGKLRVAVVTLDEINLGSILAKSLGIVWGPLNALILRGRDEARPVRLYYCDGPGYSGYAEGFRVDQAVVEIADHRAEIALAVAAGTASLRGSLDGDIDLGFLRISAPDYSRSGPEISVDDKERALTLDAGITFLGERFGTVKVAARPPTADGYELRGEIHSQVDILVFQNPHFTFTWSKAKGFHVENWPIPDFPLDLNFPELLNKLPIGSDCDPFVREMFKESIKTRFDLRARIEPGPGSGLRFSLSGQYRLLVDSDEVVTVPLPLNLIVLLKPDRCSFAALASAVQDAIQGAATALVQQLVDPRFPERTAKCFRGVLVPQFTAAATELIVCRGWSAPAPVPGPAPGPPTSAGSDPSGDTTPDRYTAELKGTGMTCQQAAGLIAGAYPALGPAALITLFRRQFPETVGTPLLMLWALDRAGVARERASGAFLSMVPDVKAAAFSAALRTVHPHPIVEQAVKQLQRSQASGLQAAGHLKAAFPTLTTTQIGYLLVVHFPQTVPDARALGTALRGTGVDDRQLRTAISDLFPLLPPAEVEAVVMRPRI